VNFNEALNALQSGRPVARELWPLEEGYLKLMEGMKFVWKIVLLPNPNAGNYIFSLEDFLANDWKEFVMPGEAVEAEVEVAA
jgi:hypothetical protein